MQELVDGITSFPIYQHSATCFTNFKDGRTFTAMPQIARTLQTVTSVHIFFLKPLQPRESVGSEKPECDLILLSSSLSTSQNRDIPIGCVKEQLLCAH